MGRDEAGTAVISDLPVDDLRVHGGWIAYKPAFTVPALLTGHELCGHAKQGVHDGSLLRPCETQTAEREQKEAEKRGPKRFVDASG